MGMWPIDSIAFLSSSSLQDELYKNIEAPSRRAAVLDVDSIACKRLKDLMAQAVQNPEQVEAADKEARRMEQEGPRRSARIAKKKKNRTVLVPWWLEKYECDDWM